MAQRPSEGHGPQGCRAQFTNIVDLRGRKVGEAGPEDSREARRGPVLLIQSSVPPFFQS